MDVIFLIIQLQGPQKRRPMENPFIPKIFGGTKTKSATLSHIIKHYLEINYLAKMIARNIILKFFHSNT